MSKIEAPRPILDYEAIGSIRRALGNVLGIAGEWLLDVSENFVGQESTTESNTTNPGEIHHD